MGKFITDYGNVWGKFQRQPLVLQWVKYIYRRKYKWPNAKQYTPWRHYRFKIFGEADHNGHRHVIAGGSRNTKEEAKIAALKYKPLWAQLEDGDTI